MQTCDPNSGQEQKIEKLDYTSTVAVLKPDKRMVGIKSSKKIMKKILRKITDLEVCK